MHTHASRAAASSPRTHAQRHVLGRTYVSTIFLRVDHYTGRERRQKEAGSAEKKAKGYIHRWFHTCFLSTHFFPHAQQQQPELKRRRAATHAAAGKCSDRVCATHAHDVACRERQLADVLVDDCHATEAQQVSTRP